MPVRSERRAVRCGLARGAAPDWAQPPFLRGLCDQTVRRQGRVVSGKELGEREGAMATWWNQIVLPVGRVQDRVDAGVGGAR